MPAFQRSYGPLVKVEALQGWDVAVSQTYAGGAKGSRLWGGMVTLFFFGEEVLDIEGNLFAGKTAESFFVFAQREYVAQSGEKKYKAIVWCHSPALLMACAQAVRLSLNPDARPTDPQNDMPPIPSDEDGPPF